MSQDMDKKASYLESDDELYFFCNECGALANINAPFAYHQKCCREEMEQITAKEYQEKLRLRGT